MRLVWRIQVEHKDLDFLSDLQDVARVIHAVPSQLADMDEPVRPANVDKRAKIADARNHALDHIANIELRQQLGFAAGAPFALRLALAENQPPPVLVNFDDFDATAYCLSIPPWLRGGPRTSGWIPNASWG